MTDNTFENTDLVSDLVIARLENMLKKGSIVGRELEGDFNTAKYGQIINMRRPVYLASSDGAVIGGSDTSKLEEGTVPVEVSNRKKVVFEVSSEELALNVTDPRIKEYIDEMATELATQIELSIAEEAETGFWNYIDATSGATLNGFADAEAFMTEQGVSEMADRYGCVTSFVSRLLSSEVSTAFSFPSVARVTEAMNRAKVGEYSSIMFMKDTVLATHESGVATGTLLVNGNDQNVTYDAVKNTYTQTLNIDGATASTTGIFKAGDVINIETFDAVNRKTRNSIGELQDYLVVADADSNGSGEVALTISPPLIAEAGVDAAFNTLDPEVSDVTAMDGLAVSVKTGQNGAVRKENLIFTPKAFSLAMIDLPDVNKAGAQSSTKNIEGLSLRLVRQYQIGSDEIIYRMDALWAIKAIQPYHGFRVATTK